MKKNPKQKQTLSAVLFKILLFFSFWEAYIELKSR